MVINLKTATWDEALSTIAVLHILQNPQNGEFKAIAGALVDAESLVSLKDLVNKLGSKMFTDVKQSVNAHGYDIDQLYFQFYYRWH